MSDDQDEEEESDEDVSYFFPYFLRASLTPTQDESGKPKQEAAECKQS